MNAFTGRGSIAQLVAELERQRETKIDFVSDVRHLSINYDGSSFVFRPSVPESGERPNPVGEYIEAASRGESLKITRDAMQQLGQRVDVPVPWQFLQSMMDSRPHHTAAMMGGFLDQPGKGDSRRLFRCLDGRCRAVLSSKYRVLDNIDMAFIALQAVKESGGEVIECSLTDRNMRMKFVSRDVWESIDGVEKTHGVGSHKWLRTVGGREVRGDDLPGGPETVHPVCTVTNSETGHGGLSVQIGMLRAVCVNHAIIQTVAKQVHIGERKHEGFYTPETVAKRNVALVAEIKDSVTAAFHPAKFRQLVADAQKSQAVKIADPTSAVELVGSMFTISDGAKKSILERFLRDYDATAYGLSQAVSRVAQDVESVDVAEELELAAGKILTAPATQRMLAAASA